MLIKHIYSDGGKQPICIVIRIVFGLAYRRTQVPLLMIGLFTSNKNKPKKEYSWIIYKYIIIGAILTMKCFYMQSFQACCNAYLSKIFMASIRTRIKSCISQKLKMIKMY